MTVDRRIERLLTRAERFARTTATKTLPDQWSDRDVRRWHRWERRLARLKRRAGIADGQPPSLRGGVVVRAAP